MFPLWNMEQIFSHWRILKLTTLVSRVSKSEVNFVSRIGPLTESLSLTFDSALGKRKKPGVADTHKCRDQLQGGDSKSALQSFRPESHVSPGKTVGIQSGLRQHYTSPTLLPNLIIHPLPWDISQCKVYSSSLARSLLKRPKKKEPSDANRSLC